VELDGVASKPWSSTTGSGQGRRFSPLFYNVGTMSHAILSINSDLAGYADDEMNIVHAKTIEECNSKILSVVQERMAWYKQIGIALNLAKTELIGFGFKPDCITIDNHSISPSQDKKYLGVCIQSNLRWDKHIHNLCNKLRSAAGRIRVEGRHFGISDRKKLFMGWCLGQIYSNGLVFLASATQKELNSIQVAMNAGVRAIYNLPRYGYVEASVLRSKLMLPSVETIKSRILSIEAWKRFSKNNDMVLSSGPTTRGRKNKKMPLPDLKGHKGKLFGNLLVSFWNKLPLDIKNQENTTGAKRGIKKMFMD